MKSSEACKLLQITKPTLYKYKNNGLSKAIRLPNGYWDFDQESIYSFFNKDVPRKTYAYARVSTNKRKKSLIQQLLSQDGA
ncbi:MAG: recombinase family protein [Candidatus Lokiarchaeota archaeon]|nr:recombinase family protein [Candidatus Lokiarchaeota archaeon]